MSSAPIYEHLVVELERKGHDEWFKPHDGRRGRATVYSSPAEYLDGIGRDRWELVSVTPLHAKSSLGGVQTNVVMYTLRRPVDDAG